MYAVVAGRSFGNDANQVMLWSHQAYRRPQMRGKTIPFPGEGAAGLPLWIRFSGAVRFLFLPAVWFNPAK